MSPSDWLGTLAVSVSRHEVVAEVVSQEGSCLRPEMRLGLHFGLGTCDDDLEECNELAVYVLDPIAQPHAHVTDNLLVAAAACVQLARGVLADDFSQATFICRVNLTDSVSLSKLSCTERGLTSSSLGIMAKVPCFHSSITWSKPRLIA